MRKIPVLVLVTLFLLSMPTMAGVTGKIAGKITDADTGEPLAGVNILVEGTRLGAASDLKGNYVILNLPPGTFTLKTSMIGYTPMTMKNVVVKIDLTSTIDFTLKSQVLDMNEVVVVAERPIVDKDVSASEVHLDAQTMANLPVQTVAEVLTLQAGIQETSSGLVIRGGAVNQIGVIVDGITTNDERSNNPVTMISMSAVREVKVQTGGYNAEYGNIRSGIINVVTEDGDKVRYSGTLSGLYRPPAAKNFGPSIYSRNTYFTRPYTDPAVCWTGTNNGAWDLYTQRQYPKFEGWNAVSEATIQDADPSNDLTPEGAKRLWEWQHRRQGEITRPDFVMDAGIGGPIPLVSRQLGDMTFFLSHFREREMFVFPLSRDAYEDNSTQLKLTSELSSAMKIVATGQYSEIHSVSPYDWTTTPTGYVLRTIEDVADLVNSSSGNSILYVPGYYSPSSIYRTMIGLKLIHQLNPKTYYEVTFQQNINRYNTFQIQDRDRTKKFEPVPGYFTDEAPWGYYGYGVTAIDGMRIGGWMNLGRDKSVNLTSKLKVDLTSQLDNINQVKGGLEVVYNDYNIKSTTENPGMSTWNRSQLYRRFPYRIGAYVQDKLEFRELIVNLGLRLDYSDANGTVFRLDPYNKLYSEGYGKALELQAPKADAGATWYFSPRLGVSHPITVNSKLYFNYGHFNQEPASTYRFRLQREANGLVTSIGNPELDFERTVSYELGFAQNISDQFLLNLAAYYKDITNQPGWIYYQNINSSVQYSISANNNYEDIRGFEFTMTKRTGDWISGFINYTYEVGTNGYFGLTRNYQDPNEQRNYLRQNPYQSRPHPRPYARANINLHSPTTFGPEWFGLRFLADWNLNLLGLWKAGSYETYNPNQIPGLLNNVKWKDRYNLDLRLSKTFKVKRYELQFYADITNLLNTRYLNFAGFSDNYDYLDYLESLRFSWENGPQKGSDKIGDYRDDDVKYEPYDPNDPSKSKADLQRILDTKAYIDMPNLTYFTFLNPRDLKLGVKINF